MQWSREWVECACSRHWRPFLCCLVVAGLLAAPLQHSQAMGTGWQIVVSATPVPGPRSQYGIVADGNGHIYLYGGNAGQDVALDDFWAYDTTTNSWQMLANNAVPPLIEPHLAVDAQGQVWEFGGITAADAPHLTSDGHSFGLYEYQPALGTWRDATPGDAVPGQTWPQGREDHGFAFDSQANDLVVFAGEGSDDAVLNDLWTYNEQAGTWTQVSQQYANANGAAIAPREIYNISADTSGHLYLFGGAYLAPPYGAGANAYANDLWRYDDATQTWTLLAGSANGYDPAMPLPRHYYGQTVDAAGNFTILGGYLDAPETSPFFSQDSYATYAMPFQFATGAVPGSYGLSDFWQFNTTSGWHDDSVSLGALAGSPMIPYGLVFDPVTDCLYTFGGFHLGQDGVFESSNTLWSLDEAGQNEVPTVTATPSPNATAIETASPSPTATATPAAHTIASATPTEPARVARPAPASKAGTSVASTLRAGPYTLTLDIGPREQIYSEAQAQALHPTDGEVIVHGTAPASTSHTPSSALNHYLNLAIRTSASQKAVANIPVVITITTTNGKVLQSVPVVIMQRIAKGPADRHFGNNISLPAGHYHVVVRAEQSSATFNIQLSK